MPNLKISNKTVYKITGLEPGPLEPKTLHRNNRYKPNNSLGIAASQTDRQAELQQTHLITHLIWTNDLEFL